MPTTRRSTKQHSNDPQSTKKSASPKNREKQKQPVEKPCYILLYNCSKNNDVLVPIYIDEELGEIFMKNMNLVKLIEIKTKTVLIYATLQYAKKCCKQVYKFKNLS